MTRADRREPHDLTFLALPNQIVGASADRRTVYFYAAFQIVPGSPPLRYSAGMFVWHEGKIAFVGNLPGEDQLQLIESFFGKTARVSPSGDLAFLSDEPTVANPAGSCPLMATRACDMLYVYTPGSPAPVCVSCHPDGSAPSTDVPVIFVISGGGESVTGHLNRMITGDGSRVFFSGAEVLVSEDVNGRDVMRVSTRCWRGW